MYFLIKKINECINRINELPVNNKTKKFMTQFINDHGGVEELKREIQQSNCN